jgi:PAS domain S-box-containing protein
MRDLVVRLGPRLALLVLLAAISAAGLVVPLALGQGPAQVLAYAALVGMLSLASAWAGGSLFISRSIKVLVAATRRIVAGDFTARVDFADTSAEIRRLGELFNEVARALEHHVTSAQRQADALAVQAGALREKARLLDLAHDAILVRGMDGVITYWNRAAEELYGWPAAEAIGSQARALLRYESSAFTMDQIEQALLSDGRWEGELTHVAREGVPIWVSSRWTLERDSLGAPLRILELNSNIGDRKRAEDFVCAVTSDLERRVLERTDELAQANQRLQGEIDERARTVEELRKVIEVAKAATHAKSTFLANMSHEIRTPLNGVTGMIGLMLNTPLTAQQLKYATIARTAAESLLALISDILDFSKLEASGVELEATPFALREVVETLLETFAPRAAQKGLELTCHFQNELPALVCGDAHRLRQVLSNLLSNAIKFTSKGHVAVRATVEREINTHIMIGFAVSDTGIGISREGRERLFQPFSQADSSISRSFGGTGLGLAISRGLVDLMGGQIEVQSEPGVGSTFRFTLVLEKVGAANGSFSWRAVADEVRRLRVLVVTGNETTCGIIREHLANWTTTMGTAPDGAAALSLLHGAAEAGEPYRLIILDLQLDRTEALRFAQTIKGGEFRDTILLAVVPLDDSLDPARWKALGFAGTVTKPLLPSRLLDAITDAVAPRSEIPRGVVTDGACRPFKVSGIRVLLAEDNEVNQLVAMEILAAAGFCCDVVATGKQALDAVFRKSYDLVLMDCQMPEMGGIEATRLIR